MGKCHVCNGPCETPGDRGPCEFCGRSSPRHDCCAPRCHNEGSCQERQVSCVGRQVRCWPNHFCCSVHGVCGVLLAVKKTRIGHTEWTVQVGEKDRPYYLCPGAMYGVELWREYPAPHMVRGSCICP